MSILGPYAIYVSGGPFSRSFVAAHAHGYTEAQGKAGNFRRPGQGIRALVALPKPTSGSRHTRTPR